MTEFTVGEYTTRDGKTAVVVGEIPNPVLEHDVLIGYVIVNGKGRLCSWSTGGACFRGTSTDCDLTPRKRKIEQWIFSWSNRKAHHNTPGRGVRVRDTLGGAEEEMRALMECGYICSEIVQAPTLEVEE
jgi:hypothetical protein